MLYFLGISRNLIWRKQIIIVLSLMLKAAANSDVAWEKSVIGFSYNVATFVFGWPWNFDGEKFS